MSGINKVILVGHLGKDPEVRHLENGTTVVNFPLATSETYNKDGRRIEQTEWHNIVMWRALADVAAKYLQKGKLVYIEGKLRTRSFEDREGHKKYITEVVAENFTMLGRRSDTDPHQQESGASQPGQQKSDEQFVNFSEDSSDDLPF
jgi:single-strand DNA-binding protein